jgi:hypothetical protein
MEVEPRKPTVKGPADWFTGDVFIDVVARGHGERLRRSAGGANSELWSLVRRDVGAKRARPTRIGPRENRWSLHFAAVRPMRRTSS